MSCSASRVYNSYAGFERIQLGPRILARAPESPTAKSSTPKPKPLEHPGDQSWDADRRNSGSFRPCFVRSMMSPACRRASAASCVFPVASKNSPRASRDFHICGGLPISFASPQALRSQPSASDHSFRASAYSPFRRQPRTRFLRGPYGVARSRLWSRKLSPRSGLPRRNHSSASPAYSRIEYR